MIYFVQPQGGGLIKIGCAKDPEARLRNLQTASPVRLVILATMDGDILDEQRLHRRFRQLRQHGEWFAPAIELRSFISRLKGNRSARRLAALVVARGT